MIPVIILAIEDDDRRSKYAQAYVEYSQHLIAVASFVLYGKVSSLKDEQTQAEDVVHDAFRYVLEKDSLPEDPDQVKALLITITKHMAIDVLRKNRHMTGDEPTEIQLGYTMPEESSTLSLIVDSLPDMYKEVLILYYEYGYNAKETAGMLGINHEAVLKRLERAREMARKKYLIYK